MYLEIEGKNYVIHLKTDIDTIYMRKVENDIVHLNVPALFPQENLIHYIQKELPKVIRKKSKKLVFEVHELNIFGRNYPIKLEVDETSYLKNNILYTHPKFLSTKSSIEKLKDSLLLNFLNDSMSMLEEELNIILPEIKLKNLKTKYSSICHNKQHITYAKALKEKSKDFITYVVILTVGKFLKYSEDQIYFLLNKYVSDWRHCERIYKYEQQ
jgi:predicted metal-dependent hydrolase